MARPANAAVRESRRRSTPLDIERMNVIKALTAAEYSRRQFILNFAASRDTQLLIPGQKSDAIKVAEEWVAAWLSQSGFDNVNSEFFRYTVDSRLWTTHVGGDVDFPFAFMSGTAEGSMSEISAYDADMNRVKSELLLDDQLIQVRNLDLIATATLTAEPETEALQPRSPKTQQRQSPPSPPQVPRRRSTKKRDPSETYTAKKKRSLSLTSLEEMKKPKLAQEKVPFFMRLGRSLSRRMSSA